MSKKIINQKTNHDLHLVNLIESNFLFNKKPINRFNNTHIALNEKNIDKKKALAQLKADMNSIKNCNLKKNSTQLILGDGNIDSLIMLIGEAPGLEEEKSGSIFMGETGELLEKMLTAINIKKENIYSTYAVNFRPPEDRKPTSLEIKRYSSYLQNISQLLTQK